MKSSTACVILVVIIAQCANGESHNGTEIGSNEPHLQRSKRTLYFPYETCMGIIAAIAVPLAVPDRNIFMSYNFESNYNDPTQSNVFTEGFFNFIRGVGLPLESPLIQIHRSLDGDPEVLESPTTEQIESESQKLPSENLLAALAHYSQGYTRKKAYRAIESHLIRSGFDGKKCLLRAICEASETPMTENNGVLGDIVHIILSPSTSENEGLPPEFYKAEKLGQEGRCQKYRKHCQKSPLDVISFML
ncbi:uncharacterized protein LOC135712626 [Ochlerotatus camptorhynchus]|uniref:uncharacterized protein LOC135712626 n=1 Tax=Ochlerotatus camptorhynchus TaxID=644619 RepID=UPI0031CECC05